MSRHRTRHNKTKAEQLAAEQSFSSDDFSLHTESGGYVSLFEFMHCLDNGQYYEPPCNQLDLYNLFNSGLHHASATHAKVNMLLATFEPTKYVTAAQFQKMALSYLVTGNMYLELVENMLGALIAVETLPSMYMRRTSDLKNFLLLNDRLAEPTEYSGDRVIQLAEPDLKQEIYGIPQYLSAFHSIKLNENATLFRRRYYENGSHAGFILYSTDSGLNEKDANNLKEQLRNTRGGGAFRNVLLRAPGGSKDGLTLIPISEVAAKDEFLNIKRTSRDDMLAIHRVPPQLMGIIPDNAGGFGDVTKAAAVFAKNELFPIQTRFKEVNAILGKEIFEFNPYKINDDETQ